MGNSWQHMSKVTQPEVYRQTGDILVHRLDLRHQTQPQLLAFGLMTKKTQPVSGAVGVFY